ncbi:MAG: HAD domain-containing protein [Pseudomonadota bacterium]
MQYQSRKAGRTQGRVLFLDFDGVLHALAGSPELTRRFVWSHLLEAALQPFPEVCIVIHGPARAHSEAAALIRQMGILGQRVIDVAPPGLSGWDAISHWLDGHPEVEDYCIVDAHGAAFPDGLDNLIACDPEQGIAQAAVRDALRRWLAAADTVQFEAG